MELLITLIASVGAGVTANFIYDICKWLYSKCKKK